MKNEIVHGKCIDISVDGQGIVKVDSLVIFVKGMIPNEEADIKIISHKKNYAFGIIDKLTNPSIHRIDSICPIAYKCGGCDFRHIEYEYQLELKKMVLENTFRGLDVEVLNVIKDDNPMYYRNKVQIPVKDHEFGFYRKFSNDIVEFEDCFIQSKLSNEILFFIKKELLDRKIDKYFRHIVIKHGFNTNEVLVGLVVNDFNVPSINEVVSSLTNKFSEIKSVVLNLNNKDTNVILGNEEKLLFGKEYIIDEFAGIKVKISLKSFYQTNLNQMIKLYDKVKELACVDSNTNVLDLYSGIGTISMYLAKYAKHVTGVEIVPKAVENAKDNLKLNNITNCDFYLDDAGKNFEKYLKDVDVLIVDPPRKGLSNELINALKNTSINRIVYVSCNPATLARDLELFKDMYSFKEIQPVDMFAYTTHVECITVLERR